MLFHTVLSAGSDDAANSSRWLAHKGVNMWLKVIDLDLFIYLWLDSHSLWFTSEVCTSLSFHSIFILHASTPSSAGIWTHTFMSQYTVAEGIFLYTDKSSVLTKLNCASPWGLTNTVCLLHILIKHFEKCIISFCVCLLAVFLFAAFAGAGDVLPHCLQQPVSVITWNNVWHWQQWSNIVIICTFKVSPVSFLLFIL